MMITQHQARKYAKATGFEKLALIDDMIKALTASKKELRDQLVEAGQAEYREVFVDEYMVKAHNRKTFKRLA
jgi:hypothetical protein